MSTKSKLHPGYILALAAATQFMVILDLAVVNVALPSIQTRFEVSASSIQWVVIIYALTFGSLLLLGGRSGDILGRKRVLITGLTVFALASLVAGLAQSFGVLVAARAAQGIGAALAAPSALAVLVNAFPEGPARNKALGIFGAVGGTAATFGVIVSGLLVSGPGWHWIFLINVPIGIALISGIVKAVPNDKPAQRTAFDIQGSALLTLGLLAVVYGINRTPENGWLSGHTAIWFGAGALLLVAFLGRERTANAPLLPLSVFRRRQLNASNALMAILFSSFYSAIYLASLLMQQVLHYSPVHTGLAYLAMSVTAFFVAGGLTPVLIGKIKAGPTLVLGQVFGIAGFALLAFMPDGAEYWRNIFPGFAMIGIDVGMCSVALQIVAFSGVEAKLAGLAGGMLETSRELGGALGVAVIATVASTGGAALDTHGYQNGSLAASGFSVIGLVVAAAFLNQRKARERAVSLVGTSVLLESAE